MAFVLPELSKQLLAYLKINSANATTQDPCGGSSNYEDCMRAINKAMGGKGFTIGIIGFDISDNGEVSLTGPVRWIMDGIKWIISLFPPKGDDNPPPSGEGEGDGEDDGDSGDGDSSG